MFVYKHANPRSVMILTCLVKIALIIPIHVSNKLPSVVAISELSFKYKILPHLRSSESDDSHMNNQFSK